MPSVYRIGPYPQFEAAKQIFASLVVVALVVACLRSNLVAGVIVSILCGWLPIVILLHFMNFGRKIRHERLELDDTGIRRYRRDEVLDEILWSDVTHYDFNGHHHDGPVGYSVSTERVNLSLREDFENHAGLLEEVSRYTGKPVPEEKRP